jgi:hypothetical protein
VSPLYRRRPVIQKGKGDATLSETIVILSEAKNFRFQAGTEGPREKQDEYQTYFEEITTY